MLVDIKAPVFPESVTEGTVATWHKKENEAVQRDEVIVEIETDKVVLEVVAPADGQISSIMKKEGESVLSQEVLAQFEKGKAESSKEKPSKEKAVDEADSKKVVKEETPSAAQTSKSGPAARRLMKEKDIEPESVGSSGERIAKSDVLNHINSTEPGLEQKNERVEKRVPMTRLRSSIAARLVQAQHEAAMLTTFNEVNMHPVMELRRKYKDIFSTAHDGARLGFMGFFVKAACEALKRFPSVNASIDGNDIVYHGYVDIGVAVSTEKGLLVPIIRNADNLGLAGVENSIREFGARAGEGKIQLEELQGGTFTISNGGVFGSLLSTPILNPPQTAILGMHSIQERPMAVDGKVVILPMMYLALSYDHRVIDGREAVQFLATIKNIIEDPARVLLGL